MTPKQVLDFMKQHEVQIVDIKFMDFPGMWQHFSVPSHCVNEGAFEEGFGFDGSSIRGWQAINESDMLVKLDPATAILDPFTKVPTLSIICNILDPVTGQPYSRDPRFVAQKAVAHLKTTGIADQVFFGPEAEFFIFDHLAYHSSPYSSFYEVDSVEGYWNTGNTDGPNLGFKSRLKEGYFPVAPTDTLQDIRTEMVLTMQKCGINIEAHHHEVASGGQCEIDMRFDELVTMADKLCLYKYIVKNVARQHGKVATFMPKPMFGDNGSGMHCHQSFWKNGKPLFAGDEYGGLSEMALYYIGGLLKHAHSILAFAAPTTNSYKRLVPGYEAPVNLAYSSRNRSAAVRIPLYSTSPKAKRIEFRPPDPSCNPYLAFSAMMMAGLDGVQNKLHPGDPLDKNIYELSPEEKKDVPNVPGSLDEALTALEKDHEYLIRGNVFTEDVIMKWIEYKREHEVDPVRLRPHPHEYVLYSDI